MFRELAIEMPKEASHEQVASSLERFEQDYIIAPP
jgi:hypothetical protein